MRYTSSGRSLVAAAALGPIVSVLLSWALSVSTDRNFLPIIGGLGDEPLTIVFLLLPSAAAAYVGRLEGRSASAVLGAALFAVILTVVLAYVVWIAWIVVVCSLQDNACFD
jgi:hypothetical protein